MQLLYNLAGKSPEPLGSRDLPVSYNPDLSRVNFVKFVLKILELKGMI